MVGAEIFTALMVEAGDSAAHAHAMYDQSVTIVVLVAAVVAVAASLLLAIVLSRMLARPLAEIGSAARRIAEGDYAARVPREGPDELLSLADSFNQMAASLERQEAMRRDFIANAAHELRTPLTNLQGYLEALRDGVITADRATYESLWDEAERLVRLSRSLDSLAEGDAAGPADPGRAGPRDGDPQRRSSSRSPGSRGPASRSSSSVPERLPARANADQLAQVLANLLSNAARYTPAGGTVTIRAERRAGGPPGLDREQRRGDPARGPRPGLRALLPGREVARPGARRRGHRPGDRQAARRIGRRPGRRGVGVRHDAVLVQPAGLTQRGAEVGVDHLAPARGFEFECGHRLHRSTSSRLQVVHLDLKCLDLKRLVETVPHRIS